MSSAYAALAQENGLHDPSGFFPALGVCVQNKSHS